MKNVRQCAGRAACAALVLVTCVAFSHTAYSEASGSQLTTERRRETPKPRGVRSTVAATATTFSTSYITYNMAGADVTGYGSDRFKRTRTADFAIFYTRVKGPHAIALQEVCDNVDPALSDAKDRLLARLVTEDKRSRFGASTKTIGTCVQANWVFAIGPSLDADVRELPFDSADNEIRNISCLKIAGYVITLSCSTHWTTEQSSIRYNQAVSADQFMSSFGQGSYAVWVGGDFNTEPSTAPAYVFYSSYYEGDRFLNPPSVTTESFRKYDYSFGKAPIVVSQPGSVLDGVSNYSDHQLYYTPFNWL